MTALLLKIVEISLTEDLKKWWDEEQGTWDSTLDEKNSNSGNSNEGDDSVWDSMPTYDSKTVARSSPVFEKHLGEPLDVSLIRPGGYDSFDEMVDDLIPKAVAMAQQSKN
ncbi:hypothetical protein [Leptospira weilii]|uniref:hypothetical protein n=1 Tax=Leptospira weilii TaxID=28184 RepID=UPI0003679EEC|nr:hypothetical protein [Leptospira weilii]OMI16986.1 hypothetical protein BUQ74_12365 [Leptospira weilii serovar Heyan]ULH27425.1 hypothetical protein FH586_13480 [Leptospira weilii]UPY77588.1 hypothetical protein FH581_001630 [Leptospira weilii]